MGEMIFLELIYQSMKESAQQVRRTLGRPSSRATRQQALRQVAMLKTAKEAWERGTDLRCDVCKSSVSASICLPS